ncbi:phosphatidyl inositol kinase [Entophlyctis sp. JEL0112]|nr:phosphatidyl inositol kinase [Entophlyctis sp. JEL0112]
MSGSHSNVTPTRHRRQSHQFRGIESANAAVPSLLPDAASKGGILVLEDSLVKLPDDFVNLVPSITPVDSHMFCDIIEEVKAAIAAGIYPERISKGSSGSYFCKNRAGKIVGVFKPKNEEPYGNMNPKWTKWLHKNLLPCCFGRSCLIPNSGYLSEAGASFIDSRLGLNVVPRTEVVGLASPTFFYTWYEKWMYVRGLRPLPVKLGSFQLFLNGFKDATTFFQNGYDEALKRVTPVVEAIASSAESVNTQSSDVSLSSPSHPRNWDAATQKQFQLGFERLVVLDYLIRNTDRGMDNWMIRHVINNRTSEAGEPTQIGTPAIASTESSTPEDSNSFDDRRSGAFATVPPPEGCNAITVAAIDNGLAFPFKHPDKWRSYPSVAVPFLHSPVLYGWAYLPIAKVPFSKATRDHVLYYLTSQEWWKDTLDGLERIFKLVNRALPFDPDFNEDMWRKQRGVIRGEGYNLAEVLRRSEIGDAENGNPWSLVRRPVVAVYEEDDHSDDEHDDIGEGHEYADRAVLIGAEILGNDRQTLIGGGSEAAAAAACRRGSADALVDTISKKGSAAVRDFHEIAAFLPAFLGPATKTL